MNTTRYSIAFALSALVLLAPEMASAAGLEDTVGRGLCNIVQALRGTVGRGIATLAVLFLGIGAFFGKVNWGLAVMVGIGIAAIFGAAAIVDTVGGVEGCGAADAVGINTALA